jgi:hypothetical protein
MNEHHDRRAGTAAAIDVELLDVARAVGAAVGLAETGARQLAVGDPALADLVDIGRIGGLIVGAIELGLVVIDKDLGTFLGRRGCEEPSRPRTNPC